jgi:carbon-monoxide dehydrogenase large subunit
MLRDQFGGQLIGFLRIKRLIASDVRPLPLREPSVSTVTGQPIRRKEDLRFITGNGRYTDDVKLPNQTFAVFVRSPIAHGKITQIDSSTATGMPGVRKILTGADYADSKLGTLMCGWMIHSIDGSQMRAGTHPPLAFEKVRYVGDPVAVVIADSLQMARAAAEMVEVDYDDLPAVVRLDEAASHGTSVHDDISNNVAFNWELGDAQAVDAAMNGASHRVQLTLTNNRLVPNAMETRALNANYDIRDDKYTLYISSQNPHGLRMTLAAVIGLAPEHKLRVISEDVGGGFGSKAFNYSEEVICAWASKLVGRPIKWTSDRSEAFLTDAHGRDQLVQAELCLDADHKITGLRASIIANMGAYLSTFGSLIPTYMCGPLLSGQYAIPAVHTDVTAVYTNTTPVDAYRGAGRPEAAYIVERLVDLAARQLGVDPAELRRKNFVRSFPYQTPVLSLYDSGDYDLGLDTALSMIKYDQFESRKAHSVEQGKLRGIGLATWIEAAGIGPSKKLGELGSGAGLWESAQVRVNPTGSVEILTGSHSHGQGHETTFAQLVADKFGISMDDIDIIHGDTDKVQFGMGTFGSRSGPVGMSALSMGCDKIVEKGKRIAAYNLDVAPESVEFEAGEFSSPGSNRRMAFAEVALAAYVAQSFPTDELEPGLKADAFFDPPDFTFPAGCHICEVEIDPETGMTEIVDFVAVDDFGTVINPMIVHGQMHGGIAQGIGQALHEQAIFDDEGQLLTGSFMDYCMPRADDLPSFRTQFTDTKTPNNPLGMKGCGEAGAIGAPPAVINAITNALDIDHIDMPATPLKIWSVLHS